MGNDTEALRSQIKQFEQRLEALPAEIQAEEEKLAIVQVEGGNIEPIHDEIARLESEARSTPRALEILKQQLIEGERQAAEAEVERRRARAKKVGETLRKKWAEVEQALGRYTETVNAVADLEELDGYREPARQRLTAVSRRIWNPVDDWLADHESRLVHLKRSNDQAVQRRRQTVAAR
jgi:phage shock protein A